MKSILVACYLREKNMRKPSQGHMLRLQTMVVISMVVSQPPAVLGLVTDDKCKCFMCICDVDPHPLPPALPAHHPPPPSEPEVVSQPPPALPEYHHPPPSEHEPTPDYHYYPPPYPYGYPWEGTTYYGPPAGEMYPRDKASKSSALRQGGHGLSSLILAVLLASAVLSVLTRST
ncbi:protein TRACHEARY ELEMENT DIFFERENTIATION-RELATED 7-like [Phragmites australis]|uniref:protein TRACHEARY ELEMENT DIFFERENTIATION-RELATED 7-like n=1 Tax=Phragmites australis TaxID=29695 RepID=UPI002D784908|nr:protein TRACHEARY ELEMENT DIFFERENTIATION-RELATED 7-like [Phragmites australis]